MLASRVPNVAYSWVNLTFQSVCSSLSPILKTKAPTLVYREKVLAWQVWLSYLAVEIDSFSWNPFLLLTNCMTLGKLRLLDFSKLLLPHL